MKNRLLAGLVFFCSIKAFGTVVKIDDLKTMTQNSDLIVQAMVTDRSVKTDSEGRIITLTTLEVVDGLKGSKRKDVVTVYQVGGTLGGRSMHVVGAHRYRIGEELVLFALRMEDMVVSYSVGIGKFNVVTQGLKKAVIEDIHDLVETNPESGDDLLNEPVARQFKSLETFKSAIRAALQKSSIKTGNIEFKKETKAEGGQRVLPETGEPRYRFICNGIDANGNIETDACGVCDDVTGPRWMPSSVSVRVDPETRPRGVSRADWLKVVSDSMKSWNDVVGANIQLTNVGIATSRSFGSNRGVHELFWILDRAEWRKKVGGGERGALGVTVAPYDCPSSSRSAREIYDADLAMNGVGDFKWAPTCNHSSGNCESIRSTLGHELGHFVGLGHPCTLCSWSIMSAQAGYDVDYPLFHDQEGLRALYPAPMSGEMGQRCNGDGDCKNTLTCVTQEDARYCSSNCDAERSCPEGYVCTGNVCQFAPGRPISAGLGENCRSLPCKDGLVCAGLDRENYYCFDECSAVDPCTIAGETCSGINHQNTGICLKIAKFGESCGGPTRCDGSLMCFAASGNQSFCRSTCNPRRKTECPTGLRCEKLDETQGVCLPEELSAVDPANGNLTSGEGVVGSPLEPDAKQNGCSCSQAGPLGFDATALAPGVLILFALLRLARKDKKQPTPII